MKKTLFLMTVASMLSCNVYGDGSWIVRGGGIYIVPSPKKASVRINGQESDQYITKKNLSGGASLTWVSPNQWGLELSAMLPTFMNQRLIQNNIDSMDIDKLRYQQTALKGQYYFSPQTIWQPYLGVGISYNRFKPKVAKTFKESGLLLSAKDNYSLLGEAGIDYYFTHDWLVNFSISYTKIRVKVNASGTGSGKIAYNLKPILFHINLGYRF